MALGEELAQAVCADTPGGMQPEVQLLASLDRRNLTKTDRWYSEKEEAIDVKTHSEEERGEKKESWEGPVMGEIVGVVTEPP